MHCSLLARPTTIHHNLLPMQVLPGGGQGGVRRHRLGEGQLAAHVCPAPLLVPPPLLLLVVLLLRLLPPPLL